TCDESVGVFDVTDPTVSITSPADESDVAGSVLIQANASDNVAVAGVQFKVDGNNLGAEDTVAPFSVIWDTTAAADGAHVLTAVARDTSDNTTTSGGIDVDVINCLSALTDGAWVNRPVPVQ